jgi:rubrerythrin
MDAAARDRIAEGLMKAYQAEVDGHNFYRMAAQSTTDARGREVFELLAREEEGHARFLQAQHAAITTTGDVDSSTELGPRAELAGRSPIFSDDLKSRVKDAHMEMSALSIGIQLELSAIQFYKAEAAAAAHPKVTEFFERLVRWESGHYHVLLRQHDELKEEYWSDGGFSPF